MGPQVKGIAFRSALQALERIRGNPTVETAIAAMPLELERAVHYGTLIASGLYPIEWYRDFMAAIVATTGNSESIVREIGRESARLDITGIFKPAFKLLSPHALFDLSARLFSTYYDTGTLSILEAHKGFARARWTNCFGFDRNMWIEVISATEMYLELSGAANVRVRVVSGAGPTDSSTEIQARWS
jgi:hypothetical protein